MPAAIKSEQWPDSQRNGGRFHAGMLAGFVRNTHSPDLLTEEEVRRFFLDLITVRKAAKSTVTIYLCGIKFFFAKTLGRQWPMFELVKPRRSKKLPVVLSREEVRVLLKLVRHPVSDKSKSNQA